MKKSKNIYQRFPIKKNKMAKILDFIKLIFTSNHDFLSTIDYLKKENGTNQITKNKIVKVKYKLL